MKRRAFLQQTGFALTSLGLSGTWLRPLGNRYHQALAASTPRKLALLIGINQYPHSPPLNGCLTDVELQRELLQYRFGFQPGDILTLTDQHATRSNLETAFVNHLIQQAQPNDVVVVHFSGYGSYLADGEDLQSGQTCLLPVDSVPSGSDLEVNALLEETLLLLLRSLPTDRVTTILDTSYRTVPGPSLQGNLRLRAKPTPAQAKPSAAVLAFQERLLSQFNASKDQARVARQSGQMPGVVLSAATDGPGSQAFEARWSGFSAGVFTQALTQYLWNATPGPIQVSFSRTSGLVKTLVGSEEQPILAGQKSREQALLPYYLLPDPQVGIVGVITTTEDGGKTGRLWLAGLPANILEYYGANSLVCQLSVESEAPDLIPLSTRLGLEARVHSSATPLQPGQYIREYVRVLPRQIPLLVALDPGLERIERVDATSAFAGLPGIKAVAAGEQPADCLFGRVGGSTSPNDGTAPNPLESHYALFSPGRDRLPGTQGKGGEAVKVAVQRLAQPLRTLLAAKLLRLTAQTGNSQVAVQATLEQVTPQEQILVQQATIPTELPLNPPTNSNKLLKDSGIPSLKIGDRIRYRLRNLGDRPLYFILLGLDTSGSLIAFYGGQPEGRVEAIAPGETLTLPQASSPVEWILREPAGLVETHLLFSYAPFTQTLAALDAGIHPAGNTPRLGTPTNPLEVAQAVLQDLHTASLEVATVPGLTADQLALQVDTWASFNVLYQVT